MLDPETPDERRDQIASDARGRIESSGSLVAENAWGLRKLAYEIRRRNEADYRFFRFQTEPPLLEELDHSLKITDGVLRFRIFRVDPDSPVIEPGPPVALASSSGGRGPGRRGRGRGHDDDRPAERSERPTPAPESAAEPAAEAPAETAAPPATEQSEPAGEPAPDPDSQSG